MKLGIIIYSTDAELVFNAFRLANFSLKEKDEVRLFLLASGVEYESLHSEKFPINDLAQSFVENGGQILACGTCLNLRQQDSSELCPLSTMKDLYELIRDCDKTVTFQMLFANKNDGRSGYCAIDNLIAFFGKIR